MSNSSICLDTVRVLWNRKQGSEYFQMGVACRSSFDTAVPGQFVMVRSNAQFQPLLRRPFSIHTLIRENGRVSGFEILYKVIGPGTQKLALCRPGDAVDILGPMGSGFSITKDSGRIYMAAGGIGVAPFVFLTEALLQHGVVASGITLFLGGRSMHDLLCRDFFEKTGVDFRIATDDGSVGEKGLVTAPLAKAVAAEKPSLLYACGPVPMLKSVVKIAAEHQIRCEISIETMMACGMGACLGCAVQSRLTEKKYFHACMDGPVFDAKDIYLNAIK